MSNNNSAPNNKLALGISLGIITVLIASTVGAVGKHIGSDVNASAIVFFQYFFCLLCCLPWLLKHRLAGLKTQHPWLHTIRSLGGLVGFYVYWLALQYIPLVDTTLLRNAAPLVVPIIIFFWLGLGIPKTRWLPLIIGFIGISVILRAGQHGISGWHIFGLLSGVGLAISMVSTSLLSKTEPSGRILFYYFFISLLFVTPYFIYEYRSIPSHAWPWLIYIGLAMYLSLHLYTTAFAYVKPSILAPTSYFSVVFAGLLEWLIWGHIPDGWTLLGIALVVLGGLLILRFGKE
ncbi:DMT family transporter [Dasania sp. GY-MA-18]|uniref:DMT family transporter n=1 Tax=Dasania phycosphaerae TaxID=2950436 RepID=A0A9J6RKX0_9GAMM|nr:MULTISPECIES: DMT family transporter [Dasania]MCR8922927.1 DMT family transporter [Dasania sp. GY-MA-18]MCZ0865358.1 DMT family transporter [Dasania phycosphaerae]MCZ0869083.1 DMT family transporter [Dasania phycosphaerae]